MLAIYDMDRTITRTGTYAAWLLFWARREAPWRLALLPLVGLAGLGFVLRLLTRARLKEINQWLLMGDPAPRARVEATARDYATRVLARNIRPGALAQLAADRAAGARLVVATASYAFYAEAIASALGIDDVIATRSVWDGDRLRARIAGDNCYGPAKRAMVEDWLAGRALAGAPMRFYSDHVSDLPSFELAAEPVAANPSAALRAEAARRGWRIVDWP